MNDLLYLGPLFPSIYRESKLTNTCSLNLFSDKNIKELEHT